MKQDAITEFKNRVIDQVTLNCKNLKLNPMIVRVEFLNRNLILIQIPGSFTFTSQVWFRGDKKNDIQVLLDINSYLKNNLPQILLDDEEPEEPEIIDCDYFSDI